MTFESILYFHFLLTFFDSDHQCDIILYMLFCSVNTVSPTLPIKVLVKDILS